MGANSTQAVSVLLSLIAFVFMAGAFAGGGMLLAVAALVIAGASAYFFLKCKPWENESK